MGAELDISKAEAIPGFMGSPDLRWLAEQASQHKVIVEIGSYLGRSTRALADNTPGVVYAIDDWLGPRDVMLPPGARETIFDKFVHYMDGLQGRLLVIKANHATATVECSPDMVFIDGAHEYDSVKRDIERWYPAILPGGLICGHDAHRSEVKRAAFEVIGDDIFAVPGTLIWYSEISSHPCHRRVRQLKNTPRKGD